jgi:hypothetical protein
VSDQQDIARRPGVTAPSRAADPRPSRPRVPLRKMKPADDRAVILTSKARLILEHAHDSTNACIQAFEAVRKLRGASQGAPTDEEQDLLRAMLVMAASGLDSMTKQLIRDSLPELIKKKPNVRTGLETFVTRQLRGDAEGGPSASGNRFLARILVSEVVRDQLIEEYILALTGASLQSAEELKKAASALGIDPHSVGIKDTELKPIFDARNKIIHELDINFDHPNRNRESRTRPVMTKYANLLLEVGEGILTAVESDFAEMNGLQRGQQKEPVLPRPTEGKKVAARRIR